MTQDPPKDHRDFARWFVKEYSSQLYKSISRRLIPNRYSIDDVKHYMIERILDILDKREQRGNPIEEPKTYFRKLIPYWCVEFQRMHGFIYSLPKRPRDANAEKDIGQHGFVYLNSDYNVDENNSNNEHAIQTSYIECSFNEPIKYLNQYKVVGNDPDEISPAWEVLMGALKEEEADIISCLFRYNLTVPQAAKKLGIAVSTAYQRKERALNILSGYIVANTSINDISWITLKGLTNG